MKTVGEVSANAKASWIKQAGWFLSAVVAVVLIFLAWIFFAVEWVARIRHGSYGPLTIEELGQTGDLFGGLSALFSALAFLGVAVAAYFQKRSIDLLAKQLEEARAATARAEANAETARQQVQVQIEQAKDQAQKQLRAYVLVSGAKGEWESDGKFWATLQVKNFGQTPAHSVGYTLSIIGAAKGVPPSFDLPGEEVIASRSIIGPGEGTTARVHSHDPYSIGRVNSIEQGNGIYFIYGEISYRDIFNNVHSTKYRLNFTGDNAKIGRFSACIEGNEAS